MLSQLPNSQTHELPRLHFFPHLIVIPGIHDHTIKSARPTKTPKATPAFSPGSQHTASPLEAAVGETAGSAGVSAVDEAIRYMVPPDVYIDGPNVGAATAEDDVGTLEGAAALDALDNDTFVLGVAAALEGGVIDCVEGTIDVVALVKDVVVVMTLKIPPSGAVVGLMASAGRFGFVPAAALAYATRL